MNRLIFSRPLWAFTELLAQPHRRLQRMRVEAGSCPSCYSADVHLEDDGVARGLRCAACGMGHWTIRNTPVREVTLDELAVSQFVPDEVVRVRVAGD